MICKSCKQSRTDIGLIASKPELCVNCAADNLVNKTKPKPESKQVTRGGKVTKLSKPQAKTKQAVKPVQEALEGPSEVAEVLPTKPVVKRPSNIVLHKIIGANNKFIVTTLKELPSDAWPLESRRAQITFLADSLRYHKLESFDIQDVHEQALVYYGVQSAEELKSEIISRLGKRL